MQPEATNGIHLRFDFSDSRGGGQPLEFVNPLRILEAYRLPEIPQVLQAVQEATDQGLYAAGYLAYEAAPAFDPAFRVLNAQRSTLNALPLAWFGLFDAPCVAPLPVGETEPCILSGWQATVEQAAYDRVVRAIRDAIAHGETYQANYTFRFRADYSGDDAALYHQILAGQPVPYAAYLQLGRFRVLSFSPELFFARDGDTILTRPMKGTATRGRWTEEDRAIAAQLAASEKERAENLMIVDLLRSDLGRFAVIGSVEVTDLFGLERYATVWQMTSTIRARVPEGTCLSEIFAALFPCGSVTGAPKVRTMQLLAEWEETPRQVYCGAIGYIAPGNRCVFNVPIRTLLLDSLTGRAEYGVGGGITWDSTPQGEYAEALAKAVAVTSPRPEFSLLETLRLEQGAYSLLDRHFARLEDSAAYFEIAVDRDVVLQELRQLATTLGAGPWRVRLLLSRTGDLALEPHPLEPLSAEPLPVALAAAPVDHRDPFLFHKTTHRAIYEAHRRDDVFDVLLWNEMEEATEFTRGNLVIEVGSHRFTPPRRSGLLAGTLRADLLARGTIEERRIMKGDLRDADRLWFINSVRGWVCVEMGCVS